MKKYFILILTLVLSSFDAKAVFIEGLEDVPVMDGMTQQVNDSLSFGNEESRIVEAVLNSESVKFSEVKKFYINTLPQMGWHYQGQRSQSILFEREGEIIEIKQETDNPLSVRITVKSKI